MEGFNPEKEAEIMEQHRHWREVPPHVRGAAEKARKLLRAESLDPETFQGFLSEDMIATDKKYVDDMEEKFATEPGHEYAEVLEALVFMHGELSDWLGKNAETVKTSRYDDIKNGVDLVVQYTPPNEPGQHLALAVDVTFGTNPERKIERIRKEILDDHLASIRYFDGIIHGRRLRGELSNIPRIVIGVRFPRIQELSMLWLNNDKKGLSVHDTQHILMEEIHHQLITYEQFAKENGKIQAFRSISQTRKLIEQMLKERESPKDESWKTDSVMLSIDKAVTSLFPHTQQT